MHKFKRSINLVGSLVDKVFRRSHLLARPLRIHLEVNDLCNLRCKMCARRSDQFPKNRGEMNIEVVRRLVPWFSYSEYVGLAGNGEPFLHHQIFEILKIIISAGSVPSVVTNATLLDNGCIERLLTLGPTILVVSFDGARKETFEFIRDGADFNLVVENLRRLNQRKKEIGSAYPVVNFIVCLMKQNIDELSEIVEIAYSVGVPLVIVQNVLPYNDWARENIVSDKNQIREAIVRARQTAESLGIRFEYIPMGEQSETHREESEKNQSKGYYCEFIWQQLHVEVDGNVRVCCFWTEGSVGNLLTQPPSVIWNSPGFREVRNKFKQGIVPKDCLNCHMRVRHNVRDILSASKRQFKEIWKI